MNDKSTGKDFFQGIGIDQEISLIAVQLRDDEEEYQINYQELQSAFKTTTVTVETYPTGILKKINATINDRTGDVIKGFTSSAISIAKMAALSTQGIVGEKQICNQAVLEALNRAKTLSTDLMNAALTDKARDAARDAHTRNIQRLTLTHSFTYEPKRGEIPESITLAPKIEDFGSWFLPGWTDTANTAGVQEQIRTQVTFKEMAPIADSTAKPARVTKGIVYRAPGRLAVRACPSGCLPKQFGNLIEPNKSDAEAIVSIGQLGRYRTISLENGLFEKNNVELSFAEDGALSVATTGEDSSIARAAASLQDTTGQVEAFLAARAAAAKAARAESEGAELRRLKAQTDVINAKADLIEAERRLNGLTASSP